MRTGGIAIAVVLALCSAATARTKERPRGAQAATPATGCEAFGPGFRKMDGSDTCIRVGGGVRIETSIATTGASLVPSPFGRPH